MKYPIRCQIVDAANQEVFPGITGRTPDVSLPHVGKHGLAELLESGHVQVTLDDGVVLMGYDCWWIPLAREDGRAKLEL